MEQPATKQVVQMKGGHEMKKEHEIKFGTLQIVGGEVKEINVRMMKQSNIAKCPHYINHYREDGSCKCNDPEEQKFLIKKCGYKKSDFRK
jgi:hypothetical protein